MTISFVAESHSAGYGTSYATSVTLTKPTGTTLNDLMIMVVGGTASSTPSGWTRLGSAVASGSVSMGNVQVYYKVAGSSEPSNYTTTLSGGPYWSQTASIATYRGCDTTTPVDTTHFDISAVSSTTNFNTVSVTATSSQWAYSFAGDYTFSGSNHTYTIGSGVARSNFGNTNSDPASAAFMCADSNGTVSAGSFTRSQTCGITCSDGVRGVILLNPAGTSAINATPDTASVTATANNATVNVGIGVSAQKAQATATALQPRVFTGRFALAGIGLVTATVEDVGRRAQPPVVTASVSAGGIGLFTGTPGFRTYQVPFDLRKLTVSPDIRTYVVPADVPLNP